MSIQNKINKRVRTLNGYRLVYEPENPSCMKSDNWNGYVYEHISVAEQCIKRPLHSNEVVHHLDGNRSNNKSANLLIIDRGQHIKLHMWLVNGAVYNENVNMNGENCGKPDEFIPDECEVCGKTLQEKQIKCCSVACLGQLYRKVDRPDKNQLVEDVKNLSFLAIGRKYGISDNAIRKWCKSYGIDYKAIRSRASNKLEEGSETSGEVPHGKSS